MACHNLGELIKICSVLPALIIMPAAAKDIVCDGPECEINAGDTWRVGQDITFGGALRGAGTVHVAASNDISLILNGDISEFMGTFSGTQYGGSAAANHPNNYIPSIVFENWNPGYVFNLNNNGDFIFAGDGDVIINAIGTPGRYFLDGKALSTDSTFAKVNANPYGIFLGGKSGKYDGHVAILDGYRDFGNVTIHAADANSHIIGDVITTVANSDLRGLHAAGVNNTIDGNVVLNVSNANIIDRIWGTQTGNVINGALTINADNAHVGSLYGQNVAQNKAMLDTPTYVRQINLNITNNSEVKNLRGINSSDRSAYEDWLVTHNQKPDINITLRDSSVAEELVAVGNDLVAGDVTVNIIGNSRVGYTRAGDEWTVTNPGADGWILAGAQKEKSRVDNVVVNLDTDGADQEIWIARDVSVGGRESASANVDVNSTGTATLNVFGGGHVYTGDLRAYRVAGPAVLNVDNVTFTPGNITEFTEINVRNGATLVSNNDVRIGRNANMSVDGGTVSGDGTLTVADGGTLDVGTGVVSQGTLNLDGTVRVRTLDDKNYGRLYADEINVGDAARLILDGVRAGTYKIFNQNVDITIDAGFLHDVQNNGGDGIVLSLRPVDAVASDLGLSLQAATVTAALGNCDDYRLQQEFYQITESVRVNPDSIAANRDFYEDQAARVHPYDKPVLHGVALSLQTQVADLTTSRMAMGRAGGDLSVGYGAWAQGLYNKSKYSDKFDAHTGGVAVGFDTLINHVYTFGLGYAYDSTDIDAHNRDIDIDAHTIFAYAQYKPNKWFANALINYTMAKYDEKTSVFGVPLSSKYDVDSYGAQVMTGYDFAIGITPELGARYLHITQDSYNNGLLHIKGTDSDFATAIAGMRYAFDIASDIGVKFSPELRAAATYDFWSDNIYSTVVLPGVASYHVNGDRLSRMGGEFSVGVGMSYRDLRLALNYDIAVHQDYTSQTGMVKLRYNF